MRVTTWSVWLNLGRPAVNWDFVLSTPEHHALSIDGWIFFRGTEQIVVLGLTTRGAWLVLDEVLWLRTVNLIVVNKCRLLWLALSAWAALFDSLIVLICLLILHSDAYLALFDRDVNHLDVTRFWILTNIVFGNYEFRLLTLQLLLNWLQLRRCRSLLYLFRLAI